MATNKTIGSFDWPLFVYYLCWLIVATSFGLILEWFLQGVPR